MKQYIDNDYLKNNFHLNMENLTDSQLPFFILRASTRINVLTNGAVEKGIRDGNYEINNNLLEVVQQKFTDDIEAYEKEVAKIDCVKEQTAVLTKFAIDSGYDFLTGSFSTSLGNISQSETVDFDVSLERVEQQIKEALALYDFGTTLIKDSTIEAPKNRSRRSLGSLDPKSQGSLPAMVSGDDRPLTVYQLYTMLLNDKFIKGGEHTIIKPTKQGDPSQGVTIDVHDLTNLGYTKQTYVDSENVKQNTNITDNLHKINDNIVKINDEEANRRANSTAIIQNTQRTDSNRQDVATQTNKIAANLVKINANKNLLTLYTPKIDKNTGDIIQDKANIANAFTSIRENKVAIEAIPTSTPSKDGYQFLGEWEINKGQTNTGYVNIKNRNDVIVPIRLNNVNNSSIFLKTNSNQDILDGDISYKLIIDFHLQGVPTNGNLSTIRPLSYSNLNARKYGKFTGYNNYSVAGVSGLHSVSNVGGSSPFYGTGEFFNTFTHTQIILYFVWNRLTSRLIVKLDKLILINDKSQQELSGVGFIAHSTSSINAFGLSLSIFKNEWGHTHWKLFKEVG